VSGDDPYLILCKGGPREALLWWGPNRSGYTLDIDAAGRYSRAEAEAQQRDRQELDVAVPLRVAEKHARRIVHAEYGLRVIEESATIADAVPVSRT
jgi:hypothetical protein